MRALFPGKYTRAHMDCIILWMAETPANPGQECHIYCVSGFFNQLSRCIINIQNVPILSVRFDEFGQMCTLM